MYYDDYLCDELKIIDDIFSKKIVTNEKWCAEKEAIFQNFNVHDWHELDTNELVNCLNYAEEIAYKYHIDLSKEFGKLGM